MTQLRVVWFCWEIPLFFFFTQRHLHEPAPALHQYWDKTKCNILNQANRFFIQKLSGPVHFKSVYDCLFNTFAPICNCYRRLDMFYDKGPNCQSYWNFLTNCEIHIWNKDKLFVLNNIKHIPCIVSGATNLWTTFLVLTVNLLKLTGYLTHHGRFNIQNLYILPTNCI